MVTSRWGKGAGSPSAFVGAMSVLAVLAGCGGEAPGIEPETMPRPALVHRVALSAGAAEHRLVGRVQALQSVPLAFEVSGVLASLAPREGDYFVAGERLAQLDPEPFVLARRRAQVELELASLRLERAEALQDRGSLAVAEVDEARAWRALKEVAFDEAQKALDDTSLYAPFDGRLARRHREPAMHVPMGDAVLTALDLSQVKIIVQLGRARRLELEDGARFLAEAIFPGAPEQAFPLRLLDNRAEADAGAQSYEVAFALDQPADLPLVPGMQMTVRLRPAAKDSLLGIPVVPLAALASFAERRRGFYVWRVDRATNTVRAQPVSLGLPTGEGVLVLAGLEAGDEVVVAGVTHLAEGMRIAPRDRL